MYENMYVVTKSEFDRCEVDALTKDTKYLLKCNNPREKQILKYRSITFTPWSLGDMMAFKTNQTYYFIGKYLRLIP